ncbi:MAG: 2-C-methyl-D-erythritol 2,4-cyclodiphosphate synthase [Phycisphaerae bacterium]
MIRIGNGYDSHRFDAERPLVLGGVRIPDAPGLAGHSDADAVLHAVTDAVLGAISAGDIGDLFPDTDPRHKNADSTGFLNRAMTLAEERNYRVGNLDVTILAQKPKLKDHKPAIRRRLAELLRTSESCVSIKAKTNEGMGFVGRAEGIAVLASVLMVSGKPGITG